MEHTTPIMDTHLLYNQWLENTPNTEGSTLQKRYSWRYRIGDNTKPDSADGSCHLTTAACKLV